MFTLSSLLLLLLSSPSSATANNEDTIILSPPTTLTVQVGEAVTVPCVASGTQQPMFMFGGSDPPTGAQSNQYSFDFTAITPESNGSYSCQVGTTTSTFTINVLGRLYNVIPPPSSFPVAPLYPLPFPPLSLQLCSSQLIKFSRLFCEPLPCGFNH